MTCDLSPGWPMPMRKRQKSGTEVRDRIAHAVVAAGAAAELEAHLADRQIELVVHDQDLGRRDLQIVGERADRRARCDSCRSSA